jgi:hypothetical protein
VFFVRALDSAAIPYVPAPRERNRAKAAEPMAVMKPQVEHGPVPAVNHSEMLQTMEAFVKGMALAASMLVFVSVGTALSQNAAPGNPTNTGFMAQQPNDRLASRLVGLNIQNAGDENIGEIHDIVLTDAGAVKAYIVSVGGFLGMATRYVAIDPKAVNLTRQDEKTWKATMNANKDQLRAAPEYKYESEWRK